MTVKSIATTSNKFSSIVRTIFCRRWWWRNIWRSNTTAPFLVGLELAHWLRLRQKCSEVMTGFDLYTWTDLYLRITQWQGWQSDCHLIWHNTKKLECTKTHWIHHYTEYYEGWNFHKQRYRIMVKCGKQTVLWHIPNYAAHFKCIA